MYGLRGCRRGSIIVENAEEAAYNQDLLDRLHGKLKDSAYYARLDAERNQRDRFRRRGYDMDIYLMTNSGYDID